MMILFFDLHHRPMEVEPTEEQKEQQGFGWFGKSLGDGVYMK